MCWGVEAAALPEGTSGAAGIVPGAFGAALLDLGRRREDGPQAILMGDSDGFGSKLRGEVDQIVLDIALVVIGGRLGRMRLRRPRMFAGHVARWDRAFLE